MKKLIAIIEDLEKEIHSTIELSNFAISKAEALTCFPKDVEKLTEEEVKDEDISGILLHLAVLTIQLRAANARYNQAMQHFDAIF